MTTMNNEDPAKCPHKKIITYVIADGGQDHGKPAGLWACAECGRKFEPVPFAGAQRWRAQQEWISKAIACELRCEGGGDETPNVRAKQP